MKRTTIILAFLLAMGTGASAQYGYSSTSISQTSGTLYASTYVEVDYLTADYYSLATWNELDQSCTVYTCDYPENGVAGAWSYGTSSTSWSGSTPVSYAQYTLYAEPEVVTYYYYYNQYSQPVYEDEYGYSFLSQEYCTPSYYEYAPDSYVEIATNIIPLDLAYTEAATCDFTITPTSAHTDYCTNPGMKSQLFGANVTPSLSQCLPVSGSCSASYNSGDLDMADTPQTCNIQSYSITGTAYFFGPGTASSNNYLNLGFNLTLAGNTVSHTNPVQIICP